VDQEWLCLDGNEAAARIAYALSEVVAIYPITPASPMGEVADDWAAKGLPNLWGVVPDVIEMQSEAGAAGVLHGALQKGAFSTTFTASQGLLLMIPNMFKIAGEKTPTVMHVAARALATHALSIFGDHSDVMAARMTGWAMLASASVQEAHDLALIAHASALRAHLPFLHFFDGFRTSHEVNKIALLSSDDIRAMLRDVDLLEFRARGLTPDAPVLRGTAQNPDVHFQGSEAGNSYYNAAPGIVEDCMDLFAARTGRRYHTVDYQGAPDAERVVVLMGSGVGAAQEAIETMTAAGERVGLATVRLYRPFPAEQFLAALPKTVRSVVVLDRTKEPGALGEPLYLDVVAALNESQTSATPALAAMPQVIGGRYGLSSKEFTPEMVEAVLRECSAVAPKRHFTVGIHDDVTHLSLDTDPEFRVRRAAGEVQALFFGLGSDGTVGANKGSVKIIGENTDLYVQGYFVYDSKKSGSVTVSHLRFGPEQIRSTYLITQADFLACHQFGLLERMKVLDFAREGATFLLNSPYPADEVWDHLPRNVQQQLIDKRLEFWVIDADTIAHESGLGNRINTVMQPCFFELSGALPAGEATALIKKSVEKAYGRRGPAIVERNYAAIDRSLAELVRVAVPDQVTSDWQIQTTVPDDAPQFVKDVTGPLMAGEGDLLPVSALPADGTFPTGTTKYEKRAIARQIPIWDPEVCIQCGKCAIVCPHATIRMKVYPPQALAGAPEGFRSIAYKSKALLDHNITIQVAPDDCTGCGVCVEVCPAKAKTEVRHKAINMASAEEHRDEERRGWDFFGAIAPLDRDLLPHDTVKGSQVLEPLFEFSGACAGCGETPYVKLLSQLFGDRIVIANATGCSSIYGGNLPTTPWTVNSEGRGPAWSNSLFEDAAEFGLGMRLGYEAELGTATMLLEKLAPRLSGSLAREILDAVQDTEPQIAEQRKRVAALVSALQALEPRDSDVDYLLALAGSLVRKGVWIIGGDGWAYDIGFGGLDHVLSSGRNVNVLCLDTEVYSNTGGQASKSTSRGAVAKFASRGKGMAKKDLGAIARSYGDVYVAQIALGANDAQSIRALLEAEAWPGPSLVIAYSTCISHGIDMSKSMAHMKDAVRSGYWNLYRYQPTKSASGQPFNLDSKEPSLPVREFVMSEARYAILSRTDPARSELLMELAQADIDERWRYYRQLAAIERSVAVEAGAGADADDQTADKEDQP
jgi:pyruvate-ferredoxin/flavodoxin oxidoreductase